jgi:large subunit ribosomal protein L29
MTKKVMQELNKMNVEALQSFAEEIRKELFLLRMKKFSTPEKNTALSRNLKKSLARTLTVLKQREMHGGN